MSKIVVTGYGVINALGKNKEEVYENIFGGKCGISQTTFKAAGEEKSGSVGKILDLCEENEFFDKNDLHYDRCANLALIAAKECLDHSGFDGKGEDSYRRGVAIGTSLGGMLSGERFHEKWLLNGLDSADSKDLELYPLHAMADVLAKEFEFKGVKNTISTACAASGNIVGYGADMIKSGNYDYMLVGGVDPLSIFSFSGFTSLKALDADPCKPYSASHGINLGEGAAFMLLESEEHAISRGAKIYAQILGYGITADAYHPTAPDIAGGGAIRAMKMALNQSGLDTSDVSYINSHGTGTNANDKAERIAYKNLLGGTDSGVPMSSIKGAIGHNLGAAGAQNVVISIMALNNNKVPPTIGFSDDYEPEPIDFVPNKSKDREVDVVLSNSFAFGGNNSCICLGLDKEHTPIKRSDDKIVITGRGTCGTGGATVDELFETFKNRKTCFTTKDVEGSKDQLLGDMPEIDFKKFINPRTLRRIDEITKIAMVSGKQALDDSGLKVDKETSEKIGVIFATSTGPLGTIVDIDEKIITKGISSISLSDFPNSVINAAAGNFCIANMLKGPTSTLSAGNASFLVAFDYSCNILKNKMADAIVLIGADECTDALLTGANKLGLLAKKSASMSKEDDGFILSQGSSAIILERKEDAKNRDAKIYAEVESTYVTSDNYKICDVDPSGKDIYEAIKRSIEMSGEKDIDLYVNTGMGVNNCDEADKNSIEKLYADKLFNDNTKCSMVTPLVGLPSGNVSGYGLMDILYSFENNEVVGLPNGVSEIFDELKDKYCASNEKKDINTAVLSAMSLGGTYASAVLKKVN